MASVIGAAEGQGLPVVDAAAVRDRPFRYYDFAMAAFVTILLCSNLIGAAKAVRIDTGWFPLKFGAGVLFFPLSYVLGDVLTEVYGFARARRVVWAGFGASVFAAVMAWVIVHLPPAPGWRGQAALAEIFGQTPRIIAASVAAFWAGEMANAGVLARLKVLTNGRMLWTRTIGSTVVGQGVDSLIFYPLAFLGAPDWPAVLVIEVMVTNYLLKVGWEVLLTPVTYRIVAAFKQAEGVDVFDRETRLTPFGAGV